MGYGLVWQLLIFAFLIEDRIQPLEARTPLCAYCLTYNKTRNRTPILSGEGNSSCLASQGARAVYHGMWLGEEGGRNESMPGRESQLRWWWQPGWSSRCGKLTRSAEGLAHGRHAGCWEGQPAWHPMAHSAPHWARLTCGQKESKKGIKDHCQKLRATS